MAKRGRKKGGFKINHLTDKNEIFKLIKNQANTLNKKIKEFREKGITEHESFYKQYLEPLDIINNKGTVSKSKKLYTEMHLLTMKKTLSALHKINNDPFLGTVKKYNSEVDKRLRKIIEYARKHLEGKGYSPEWVNNVVESKSFIAQLIMSYNDNTSYESDQQIDKIALTYEEDPNFMSREEMDKLLNNIEQSQNAFDRLEEQRREFEEFKAMKNRNNGMR